MEQWLLFPSDLLGALGTFFYSCTQVVSVIARHLCKLLRLRL